ncbi:hypothetical protein D3C78_808190 [compost metagenome]
MGKLIRGNLVFPYVNGNRDSMNFALRQLSRHRCRSFIIKPHSINKRLILRQPEQSRLLIAGLRLRSNRTHLGEAEANTGEAVCRYAILIETGSETDRMRELQSEQLCSKLRRLRYAVHRVHKSIQARHLASRRQTINNKMMSPLRVHSKKNRF